MIREFVGFYWGAKVYRYEWGWLMTPPEPQPAPKITYCRSISEYKAAK
jgi:hypothetical protein